MFLLASFDSSSPHYSIVFRLPPSSLVWSMGLGGAVYTLTSGLRGRETGTVLPQSNQETHISLPIQGHFFPLPLMSKPPFQGRTNSAGPDEHVHTWAGMPCRVQTLHQFNSSFRVGYQMVPSFHHASGCGLPFEHVSIFRFTRSSVGFFVAKRLHPLALLSSLANANSPMLVP